MGPKHTECWGGTDLRTSDSRTEHLEDTLLQVGRYRWGYQEEEKKWILVFVSP